MGGQQGPWLPPAAPRLSGTAPTGSGAVQQVHRLDQQLGRGPPPSGAGRRAAVELRITEGRLGGKEATAAAAWRSPG